MRVLVSVANGTEARAAIEAGADILDAKNPEAGALGALPADILGAVHAAVNDMRPVSVALGDVIEEGHVERAAYQAAALGSAFVKLAFAGSPGIRRVVSLIEAARRGVARGTPSPCLVVAAAYADWESTGLGPSPALVLGTAGRAGASGVLIDTADKAGPGLFECVEREVLDTWVATAHAEGLWIALAGRLNEHDLARAAALGADLVGLRGAVCDGGRTGTLSAERVGRVMRTCATLQVSAGLTNERLAQALHVVAGHAPGGDFAREHARETRVHE